MLSKTISKCPYDQWVYTVDYTVTVNSEFEMYVHTWGVSYIHVLNRV